MGNACTLAPSRFGLIPFRSPLLGESRLISFPRGTEMFQFPRLPSFAPMYSARDDTALPVPGFPIRVSAGQRLFSTSPRLIAAVHALPRLLMPRHPPCALTILTVIVDNGDAEASRYTTVIFYAARKRSLRCGVSVVWPTVQFSRSGEGATGGTPRLVSQNSAVQGRRRGTGPPGPVDVSGRPPAMRPDERACPRQAP